MIKKKLTISTRDLLALFLIFQFIPIYGITQIITVRLYNLVSMFVSICIILFYLLKKQKWDSTLILWLIYTFVLVFSCFLNRRTPFFAVLYGVRVLAFLVVNRYYLKRGRLEFLSVTRAFMTVVLFVTVAQQFLNQGYYGMTSGGNYETIFISDNYLGYFYTAYIALCVVLDIGKRNEISKWTYFVSAVCLISVTRSWAVKSVIGLAVVLLYMVFVYGKKSAEFFTQKKLIVAYVAIYVLVVFIGLAGDTISGILEWFGKDLSLSGRYYIWYSTINNIRKSPIYGYGVDSTGLMSINEFTRGRLISSHNMFMEVVIQTGFIGLFGYLAFLVLSFIKGSKRASFYGKTTYYEYLFLIFTVFMIFIMGIASPTIYQPFYYMPLLLLENLSSIEALRRK